ncbi:MAG: Glu-tRNA(Gln) amidotransferase subunit GatD [Candidatus Thermoplasmatota archaeon]|nr:Glu-tRNA(Gln) amidotransferase subunit GatD [Candidatus Thermoplasmatota archaeon]
MREKLLDEVEVGDRLKIEKKDQGYEGILMPHHHFSDDDVITLKLDNGYNIGIKADETTQVDLLKEGEERPEKAEKEVDIDESKPKVSILGTGGTIASYVEYRTGAVHPAQDEEDVLYSNPEIAERCDPEVDILFSKLSEDLVPGDWVKIADRVVELLEGGSEGVVISHGTDTMGYTAAALSFMLSGLSRPVVLVGSQRSSDRPSSDAHLNLLGAIEVAKSDIPGVFVVMHDSMSDDRCMIHKGTKVRKMHTSRRDAFESINEEPVGMVDPRTGEVELDQEFEPGKGELRRKGGMEDEVSLLYANPGTSAEEIRTAGEKKGLVIAGTGLGHIRTELIPELEKLIDEGKLVVMTSQCLNGTVNDLVYSAGRELLEIGVISGEDMLPETALVKLMWALSLEEDIEEIENLMKENVVGEITDRRVR